MTIFLNKCLPITIVSSEIRLYQFYSSVDSHSLPTCDWTFSDNRLTPFTMNYDDVIIKIMKASLEERNNESWYVFHTHTRTRRHFTLFDFCIDVSWALISSILRRKANSMSHTFPSSSAITSAVPPISKWSPLIILCIGSWLFPYEYRHYCNGMPILLYMWNCMLM